VKKIAPIFLFIIISINHLNILDAVMHFSAKYKQENSKLAKTIPAEEESDQEKENKGKENNVENEKYLGKNYATAYNQYKLPCKNYFIWFNTTLNKHPYNDDDTQPPKLLGFLPNLSFSIYHAIG
jgi:hypothetical protein